MGEQNELKNRYLLVNPPEEWGLHTSTPTSPEQVPNKLPNKLPNKFNTNNLYIKKLVAIIGDNKKSIKEIMEDAGLKDRVSFLNLYLNPAIKEKYARMLYPDRPRHPRQKYMLTVKGFALYNELTKEQ